MDIWRGWQLSSSNLQRLIFRYLARLAALVIQSPTSFVVTSDQPHHFSTLHTRRHPVHSALCSAVYYSESSQIVLIVLSVVHNSQPTAAHSGLCARGRVRMQLCIWTGDHTDVYHVYQYGDLGAVFDGFAAAATAVCIWPRDQVTLTMNTLYRYQQV